MIYGNIFWEILGCLDLLFDQKLLMSSIPWNRTSKDENDIEMLILTQDKNLRCIAKPSNKIMIASLGNSTQYPEKKCYSVVTGKIQLSHKGNISCVPWEILFALISKSLLFDLFSVATLVCQCFMNMWNIRIAIKFDYSDG